MATLATYVKTQLGADEVQTRKNKLSVRQRNLLIMVDGTKSLGTLNDIALKLGLSQEDFKALEAAGFITFVTGKEAPGQAAPGAPVLVAPQAPGGMDEAGKFRLAHKFMTDTIVNSLGLKAFFFTLKLEKCATRSDLAALLDDYTKALTKATSAAEAELLTSQAREFLK